MNPLLQITKTQILERQLFNKACFADDHLLRGIESYNSGSSMKGKAQGFMNALLPLWKDYRKESMVPIFKEYIDLEINIESFSRSHSSHINHVIQEFLFGYNVITGSSYFREEYEYEEGKNDSRSEFGQLFFSWMAASLFHDVGYDIEYAPEEEKFRINKNDFWSFMTPRSITTIPLQFKENNIVEELLETIILEKINNIENFEELSYRCFKKLFILEIPELTDWHRYDHGIISASKYLFELKKIQDNNRSLVIMDWEPNQIAALAMAVHNFRHKNINLMLCGLSVRFISRLR